MRRVTLDNKSREEQGIANSVSFAGSSSRYADCVLKVQHRQRQELGHLQRSVSADNVVIRSRGFKPSDRHDPAKRSFLESLTSKILHFDMESRESTPINLQKLLTPAPDSPQELVHSKNKKMYASSYFYAPTHPTVEDQVELARRISHSLSDVKNMKSKGQSMYVNRKKRSVKWIHDGNGIENEEEPSTPVHKDKIPLKCMMNPNGKVLDIHGIQALGEEVNIESMPSHPEKLFDIVRDLNNQRGRGAEIFAKRRKRSEKWVVDRDQAQTPNVPPTSQKTPIYPIRQETNENSNYSAMPSSQPLGDLSKSFYNPFSVDLSLGHTTSPTTGKQGYCRSADCTARANAEVKKIYLREVAVGPDASDFSYERGRDSYVEKSHRASFHSSNRNERRNTGSANQFSFMSSKEPNSRKGVSDNLLLNPGYRSGKPIDRDGNERERYESYENYNDSSIRYATQNGMNVHGREKFAAKNVREIPTIIDKSTQDGKSVRRANDELTDYTPVPVKQLIQEFEKTCRPSLQYKHISPKVIPIVRQCSNDNDIARFFQTRDPTRRPENENYDSVRKTSERDEYEDRMNGHCRQRSMNGCYASTDESDSITDEDDDSSESPMNSFSVLPISSRSSATAPSNRNIDYSTCYRNEYIQSPARRRSYDANEANDATSRELENLYEKDRSRYANTEMDMPAEAKSLLLSMVASQEDILDTIKQLRSTPVLDNLLSGTSPDCNFTDLYPHLSDPGKLYENNCYKGPKLGNVNCLANYNTAPRGWDQKSTYYRPVTFSKAQETIVYSDF